MNESNEENRYNPELVEMYFDAFKHLTTLNLAAIVAVLALARQAGSPPQLVVIFLATLGMSLLWSAYGIEASLRYARTRFPGAIHGLRVRFRIASSLFHGSVVLACFLFGLTLWYGW